MADAHSYFKRRMFKRLSYEDEVGLILSLF